MLFEKYLSVEKVLIAQFHWFDELKSCSNNSNSTWFLNFMVLRKFDLGKCHASR